MKNDKKDIVVVGCDISLNHSGFIELTNGELSDFWYFTNRLGAAARSKKHGTRLVLPKTKDKQILSVARIAWIRKFIVKNIIKKRPDMIGIENYSLASERGAHALGEVGGVARIICYAAGIPLRLHDPLSIKMYACHDGSASKDHMREMALERWGVDFDTYDQPAPKSTPKRPDPKQDRTISEDLCDAFAIAKLVWLEYQLRQGLIKLSELHPKEIQVFNRVTKTYPINLLGREWIVKP